MRGCLRDLLPGALPAQPPSGGGGFRAEDVGASCGGRLRVWLHWRRSPGSAAPDTPAARRFVIFSCRVVLALLFATSDAATVLSAPTKTLCAQARLLSTLPLFLLLLQAPLLVFGEPPERTVRAAGRLRDEAVEQERVLRALAQHLRAVQHGLVDVHQRVHVLRHVATQALPQQSVAVAQRRGRDQGVGGADGPRARIARDEVRVRLCGPVRAPLGLHGPRHHPSGQWVSRGQRRRKQLGHPAADCANTAAATTAAAAARPVPAAAAAPKDAHHLELLHGAVELQVARLCHRRLFDYRPAEAGPTALARGGGGGRCSAVASAAFSRLGCTAAAEQERWVGLGRVGELLCPRLLAEL
mmetsp:Transcript_29523/g.60352  ORF Transcript_29523/g.60352 Transcript_29523/m.60352 type:complete len:356 (+) Transcript_29523:580-1647(+)